MHISFASPIEVFLFIVFCSVYVCSTLWIFGDATARGLSDKKSLVLPVIFMAAGGATLIWQFYWILLAWPIGFITWLLTRPTK